MSTDVIKSAESILSAIAPTVAAALGGPFAGVAVQKLISVFGLGPDASQQDVMTAVGMANPDQLLKLKQADQLFAIEMKKLDVDLAKTEITSAEADRASARLRQATVKDWTPSLLAFGILSVYICVQWYILTHVIDTSMVSIVMRTLGTMDALIGMVFGYYFGSSAGSQSKDATLLHQAQALSTPGANTTSQGSITR